MRIISGVMLALLVLITAGCGRSDSAITAGVKAKLAADNVVHSRHIDVDTRQGIVTLSGRVDTAEERTHAMQAASSTAGVIRVIDHLQIGTTAEREQQPPPAPRSE